MNRLIQAASAAALILVTATPALADRARVSVRVSRAGLDLGKADHRAVFAARVRRASAWACAVPAASLSARIEEERCRREMTADAAATIARLGESRDPIGGAAR